VKLAYLGVLGLSLSLISCKSESTPEAGEKKSKQTTSAADESESLAALQFAKESAGAGEEEADNFPDDATTIDHSIKDRAKALRAEYDINKDGKLDDSERAALRASMEQSVLKKFDKNGDGKIDAEEDLAIRNEIHQNMKSCKAGHDKRRSMGGQGPGKRTTGYAE
ncbi:MAG: hypothetical protein NTV34_00200, partial [Proteobacteria bacterium]|nr:hypothetical protein [Pseudomonadota bacterium]